MSCLWLDLQDNGRSLPKMSLNLKVRADHGCSLLHQYPPEVTLIQFPILAKTGQSDAIILDLEANHTPSVSFEFYFNAASVSVLDGVIQGFLGDSGKSKWPAHR